LGGITLLLSSVFAVAALYYKWIRQRYTLKEIG
jgi:hypothetical protein